MNFELPLRPGDAKREPVTLRDIFAAFAMLGEIITSTSDATPLSAEALLDAAEQAGVDAPEQLAFNAYQWADAMLKERAK
jgi:hypothetical protein